jgi:cytochrome c-type biogenesis protein CcmH
MLRLFILLILFALPAYGQEDALLDQAQEKRARALFSMVKCSTCTAESIKESQTHFAAEQRQKIRQEIAAGHSDEEILAMIRKEHGEHMILQPKFAANTLLLWLLPLLALGAGLSIIMRMRKAQ